LTTRRELTVAIRQRYQVADRSGKKMILDEFTEVTGYHRKHAIRVLTTRHVSEPKTRVVRRGRYVFTFTLTLAWHISACTVATSSPFALSSVPNVCPTYASRSVS
jgi:hypothetical protein